MINESRMHTSSWSEKDYEEWENLHLENLSNLSDLFKKYRVNWWIDSGTLLGIHRDGKLIPGDSDTDVGFMCDDLNPDLISDMEKYWNTGSINNMFYHHKDLLQILSSDKYTPIKNIKFSSLKDNRGKSFKFKGKEVWSDLFVYHPWNKDILYKFGGGYFRTKIDAIGKPKYFKHKGFSFKKPENPEQHLEITYGKNWSTPTKKYSPLSTDAYGGPLNKNDLGGKYLYNFTQKKHLIK